VNDDATPCPVIGCDYETENDDWRSDVFHHVRWLHVGPRDYGEDPVPSLFGLLANGLIDGDEFVSAVGGTVFGEDVRLTPPLNHRRVVTLGITLLVAVLVAIAIQFTASVDSILGHGHVSVTVDSLSRLATTVSCFVVVAAFGVFAREVLPTPYSVRIDLYPDTDIADDDMEV
jgi:hypothetical protein